MGRPPSCDCHCGVDPPTECEFSDTFGAVESGYTTYALTGSSTTPVFATGSGVVSLFNGSPVASGTYYRTVSLPSSGLKTLSVEAIVSDIGTTATVGVFIGNAVAYFRRKGANNFGRQGASSVGEAQSPIAATFGTSASGDVIKLQIQETSTGVYDVVFYQNGSVIRTETGLSLAVTDTVNVGLYSTNGGTWDNFAIACDDAPAPSGGCSAGSAAPAVWTFNVSGIQNFNPLSGCANCQLLNGTINLYYSCSLCSTSNGQVVLGRYWNSPTSFSCSNCTNRSGWGLIVVEYITYPFDVSWEGGVSASLKYGQQRGPVLNNPCGATSLGCSSFTCRDSPTFAAPPSLSSSFPPSHTWNWLGSNTLTAVSSGATSFPVCCTNLPSTITITPA